MSIDSGAPSHPNAEAILHEAMSRVLEECNLKSDPAAFVILTQSLTTKLLARMVTDEILERDNGRNFINGVLKQMEIMITQEINARIVLDAHKRHRQQ